MTFVNVLKATGDRRYDRIRLGKVDYLLGEDREAYRIVRVYESGAIGIAIKNQRTLERILAKFEENVLGALK